MPINVPNKVILHCAVTPDYKPIGKNYNRFTADDIRYWHIQRGFDQIGYHTVVERSGTIEHICRPHTIRGAHCKSRKGNINSLGVCYIGTKKLTPNQVDALVDLFLLYHDKYGIGPSDWLGHCELDPKHKPDCPGVSMEMLRKIFELALVIEKVGASGLIN